MPPWLQTHSAPTWLTQCISFEDNETVCVGHQEIKTKVKTRPSPAVLRKGKCHCFHYLQPKPTLLTVCQQKAAVTVRLSDSHLHL